MFADNPRLQSWFEVGGKGRLLPMEGIRGVAVGLVFLQHFSAQFVDLTDIDGVTGEIARIFKFFGNFGVELFFVLSGYLIYGMLLRRRTSLFDFMWRRAVRLYPAFLVALLIGILLDFWRPTPKIPEELTEMALYLGANLAFLPGLFDIEPLFAVNWSLSYEWWFYFTCAVLVSSFNVGALASGYRLAVIGAGAIVLLGLSAAGVDEAPVRGLCLLAGMLLAEAQRGSWQAPPARVTLPVMLFCCLLVVMLRPPEWITAVLLAIGFYLFAATALLRDGGIATGMSTPLLRWFGNMSYSYYLVHGFVVVAAARLCLPRLSGTIDPALLYWAGMLPVFAITFGVGAGLFLLVEKPFSLKKKPTLQVRQAD